MAELQTKPSQLSVADFLNAIPDEARRKDCKTVARIMQKLSGHKPKMWGPSIVGFGEYPYKYASGREGTMCRLGFSPRKNDLTLYLHGMHSQVDLMKALGKHKTGKACLYLKNLGDVDLAVLTNLIERSLATLDQALADQKFMTAKQ